MDNRACCGAQLKVGAGVPLALPPWGLPFERLSLQGKNYKSPFVVPMPGSKIVRPGYLNDLKIDLLCKQVELVLKQIKDEATLIDVISKIEKVLSGYSPALKAKL